MKDADLGLEEPAPETTGEDTEAQEQGNEKNLCPTCGFPVRPGWFLCPECKNPLG